MNNGTEPKIQKGKRQSADPRAQALKANLAKRKAQSGARRSGKAIGKNEADAFQTLRDEKADSE